MNHREVSYVVKVLKVLRDYGDWLSKSDICLLADETPNASYMWGVIDALIATQHITQLANPDDMRFKMCRISETGERWLATEEIPF